MEEGKEGTAAAVAVEVGEEVVVVMMSFPKEMTRNMGLSMRNK